MKSELKHKQRWSYYNFPELERQGISHGFFTKQSPLHDLEGEERDLFLEAFGLKDAVSMKQEHGTKIHVIHKGDRPESGDGLIVVEKGVAGIIKTADCLPVMICEIHLPIASIVHAGWRGTAQKITQKAIEEMTRLGAKTANMVALLGPCINHCCYRVGEDVHAVFKAGGFTENVFRRQGEAIFLDIKAANGQTLKEAGVNEVYDVEACTGCNSGLFHSYRSGERDNRQINFVSLK